MNQRQPNAWRVLRLGSTDIFVQKSLPFFTVVLVVLLARQFDSPGVSPYLFAMLLLLGLYASVFVHELAHRSAALGQDAVVPSMMIHVLGGYTAIIERHRTPWREAFVAAVGPLTSLGLAGLALAVHLSVGSGPIWGVAYALMWANLLVAGFNLLPALPLDGGRVFSALLWKLTGHEPLALRITAWVGGPIATAVVVAGLVLQLEPGQDQTVNIIVGVLIAVFLAVGARQAVEAAATISRLEQIDVEALLEPLDSVSDQDPAKLPVLPHGLNGEQLARAIAISPHPRYLVLDEHGAPAGVLHPDGAPHADRRET